MGTPIIYGIPTCDSCRKTIAWFKTHQIAFEFHDLRADGAPTEADIRAWCTQLGWKSLLNRRSTTFRSLDRADQLVDSAEEAIALMVRHPLLLKRPVIETEKGIVAGFDPDRIQGLFTHA